MTAQPKSSIESSRRSAKRIVESCCTDDDRWGDSTRSPSAPGAIRSYFLNFEQHFNCSQSSKVEVPRAEQVPMHRSVHSTPPRQR